MLKLFREQAHQLLLLVTAQRLEAERDPGAYATSLHQRIRDWYNANLANPMATSISAIPWDATIGEMDFEQIQEDLISQLEGGEQKGDVKLIDTIVDILTGAFGVNRMTPETLDALRRAILRSGEVEDFRKKSKAALGCMTCGNALQNEEVGVIRRLPHNEVGVECMQCARPRYLRCGCGDAAVITSEGQLGLKNPLKSKIVSCGCKGKVKEKEPVDDIGEFARQIGLGRDDVLAQLARGAGAARGFRPAPPAAAPAPGIPRPARARIQLDGDIE